METRIACLSADPDAPFGAGRGASVRVSELVRALAREGARVVALVSGVARGAARPEPGATVEPLPGPSFPGTLAAERRRTDWIARRLERFGAQALYERLADGSAAGSRAAASLGIPHFVEIDAPLKAEPRRRRGLHEPDGAAGLEREVLARAERVLAVSSPLARHALRRGAHRVEVFGGAVAMDRHPPRTRRRAARPVAVFTGRVRRRHGIEAVATAWRLMGNAAPVLVVAGDAGEAAPLLERAGAVLLGPIPHCQVPAVLAEADIGLAPYAREAPDWFSPLKVFEYMAAGLAVVTGDLPATRELVSGEHALLVPCGDPEALAAAVAGLTVDAPFRERMGSNARTLVAEEHTWRHRARRLIEHVAGQASARAAAREAAEGVCA
jgi:glycosyltransferase involved in cell wall biosynthesis